MARSLRTQVPASELWDVELGARCLPFYSKIATTNSTMLDRLPLPSARLHLEPGPLLDLYQSVCQSRGLELRELRVKYPRDSFFSKGDRPTTFVPLDATWEVIDDELYPGKKAAIVVMSLPRGSYATIVVKRLTSVLAISSDKFSFESE